MNESETMTPLERQFELRKAGYTQKSWAKEQGVVPMSVSHLIWGKMVSHRLMQAFTETIGKKDRKKVFPEYFLDPNRRKRKPTTRTA